MTSHRFRFDPIGHIYFDLEVGDVVPSITQMLQTVGLIDDRWFSEEGCERGTAVHELTAEYDLGVLAVAQCDSPYRGYLLGHVEAMRIVKPEWTKIEIPCVHPIYRYGGRTDRAGRMYKLRAVCEVKTGAEDRAHQIQTALQAILEAADLNLPPESVARFCLYLKGNGKFKLVEHHRRADFYEAHRIIRRCC